jgi:hypothetical protein
MPKGIGNLLLYGPSVSPDQFGFESFEESFDSGKNSAAQSETYGNCLFFVIARCKQLRRAVPVIDQNVAGEEASTIERVMHRRVVH